MLWSCNPRPAPDSGGVGRDRWAAAGTSFGLWRGAAFDNLGSRMARADGRDAHAGAVHRAGVDLRAQARRHPPARVQGRAGRAPAVAQPAAAERYPSVAEAIADLPVHDVILDGEVTWGQQAELAYHVFDVLWLDGRDVTSLPLEERRALLSRAAASTAAAARDVARQIRGRGSARCSEGWEGVIAKRRDSPYEHRRSPHWLKMKCEATQELVVGGFTDPQGRRVGLGALLVGYFEGDDFVFAGKVGTGFDTKLLLELRARLDALEIATAAVHQSRRAAAPAARTGCAPRSSCRSPSSSGRRTASCAIRGCWASAPTSPRARSCGRRRDHAPGEGAVPGRRDHQGRARRLLRGDRAAHAAAHPRPAGHDGALSRRHRRARASCRRTSRRASPTGWSASRCRRRAGRCTTRSCATRDRCSGLPTRTASRRTCGRRARRTCTSPTSASSISIPSEDEPDVLRAAALGAARPAARAGPAELGEDVGLEGLPHRRAARRRGRLRRGLAVRARRRARCWSSAIRSTSRRSSARPTAAGASSSTPDATATARPSPRPTPCARSPARPCPRRAPGRRSSAARSARGRSRCGRWPPASPRSATCGRTCTGSRCKTQGSSYRSSRARTDGSRP